MDHHFIQPLATMPPAFENLWGKVQAELDSAAARYPDHILLQAKDSIGIMRSALQELKAYVVSHEFTEIQDEIVFFKEVKPAFHALLVYWVNVFGINIRLPIGNKKVVKKYVHRHFAELHHFFVSNADFYRYYRSGETDMDAKYFLRINKVISIVTPFDFDDKSIFSTSHDRLVTSIIANQLIGNYLNKMHAELELQRPAETNTKVAATLKWTGSKAGLVELIYALQSVGVYNGGNADIKQIAAGFEKLFHVDLGNYYNIFNEIRLRKKNRSQLLDQLKEKLLEKMDTLDEK